MKPNKSLDPSVTNSMLQQTPIAVIGLGALFPNSENVQQYWTNILNEVDCITDVPASRWDVNEYYDPDPRAEDKTYCKRGGFIPDVDFNPMDFGIPPNILEATDISQLLSLVVAKNTLEDAGYGEASGMSLERTGAVLGVAIGRQLGIPLAHRLQSPIWERVLKNCGLPDDDVARIVEKMKAAYVGWQENSFPGLLGNVVAGRIANRFNMGGTNCVVDAACASSLSAVKMAISELLEHRCDMMLTGGVDTDNSIMMYMCFSKTPAFTTHDHVRPFDAESNGMMVGEGIGMLMLKRLEDAERDNDRVYAVIRGIGTSSDGRYKSIYAPRSGGQALALQRAYADAGFEPTTVGLIEAHGTGTAAGDPVEVTALDEILRENNERTHHVALGSVKSQIGHTKAAAGAASLIKTSLALYHKILPATINVKTPNAVLAASDSPLYINSRTRPWMRHAGEPPRRAGVSAFGFGGTNFHVVLEEYEGQPALTHRLHSVPESILLFAQTPEALAQLLQTTAAELDGDQAEAHFHQLVQASRMAQIPTEWARVGFVADSLSEARTLIDAALSTLRGKMAEENWSHPRGIHYRRTGMDADTKVVALFPGQGSQYLEMGRSLVYNMPPVREAFDSIDNLFQAEELTTVSQTVFPAPTFDQAEQEAQEEALRRTEYAQPAIGALSAGLFKLMQAAQFQPDFVLGHSFGELTALWAAGVMNDDTYFSLVKARGQAMAAPAHDPEFDTGTMLAVTGDMEQIQRDCAGLQGITVANYNSSNQVVLAGATEAVKQASETLQGKGYNTIPLPVSAAFHTELVEHALAPFAKAIEAAELHTPHIPVYANSTAQPYPHGSAEIHATLAQHIAQPVLFKQQIENVYAAGGTCFVEIGPKRVLTNFVKTILGDKPHVAVALNASRSKDSDRQLREAVVELRVHGLPLADIDPYHALPVAEKEASGVLNVRLNASNHYSKKTLATVEEALNTPLQLAVLDQANTPTGNGTNGHLKGNGGHHSHTSDTNGTAHTANGTNGSGLNGSGLNGNNINGSGISDSKKGHTPVPERNVTSVAAQKTERTVAQAQTKQRPASSAAEPQSAPLPGNGKTAGPPPPPSNGSALAAVANVEQNLSAFINHQSESARVHEQYLNNQGEYAQIFARLMEQQHDMVQQGSAAPEQMDALRDILNTLGRSINQFHEHQGETTRVHEQYLGNQSDYTRALIDMALQRQPQHGMGTAASSAPAAPAPVVPNPATPAPQTNSAPTPAPLADSTSPGAAAPAAATPPAEPEADAVEIDTVEADTVEADTVETDTVETDTVGTNAINIDAGEIVETLLSIVSEKTGYPAEVLEMEMDIEADLGIDSIKRVEILGAMQEAFPNLPQAEPEMIGELRTLGQIVDFIGEGLANGAGAAAPASAPAPTTSTPEVTAATPTGMADTAAVSAEEVAETLLAIVSEKTGYPAEVLEMEMDIEADLGIDSIKRVEILGAMQEAFPGLPQAEPEMIGELRTLGQIIDFIGEGLASGASAAPATTEAASAAAAPSETVASQSTDAPNDTAVQDISVEEVAETLLEIVSDKTGYPAEVLEMEMDIEADLGIDSIKRVEILGAMQEAFPGLPQAEPEVIGELRTLGQIINFIRDGLMGTRPPTPSGPGAGSNGSGASETPSAEDAPSVNGASTPAPAAAATAHSPAVLEEVTAVLYEAISQETGLPAEVMYPEMDIEEDLGVDRIKRVEILSTVRNTVPSLSTLNAQEFSELHTIHALVDALAGLVADAEAPTAEAPTAEAEDAPADVSTTDEAHHEATDKATNTATDADETHTVFRHVVKLKTLPAPDQWDAQPDTHAVCLVTDDGSDATVETVRLLVERGWNVVLLRYPQTTVASQERAALEGVPSVELADLSETHLAEQLQSVTQEHGSIAAFVHIHPALGCDDEQSELIFSEPERDLVKHVFLTAKHLKESLNSAAQRGHAHFFTVSRLDGCFGLEQRLAYGVIGGGLFGLTKSLTLEWPGVFCRALDVSREMSASHAAAAIVAEMHDPNTGLAEVGLSENGRVTPVAERLDRDEPQAGGSAAHAIDSESVFLVSGGGKGITADCVVQLAKRHGCGFILMGRSILETTEPEWAQGCTDEAELKKRIVADLVAAGKKPVPAEVGAIYKRLASQREIAETLQRIADAGGRAQYLSVDITDGAAVTAAVAEAAQAFGPITGIVHGAGNLADKWIEKKTEADFDLVYSTKVKGLENLLRAVPVSQLHHLVLFASTAGFHGNVGQTDYALANEVFNKMAHAVKRSNPDCHVVSINWGPWDGGMVSDALKRIFALHGIEVIPLERGAQLFVDELDGANGDTAQVVVSGSGKLGDFPAEAGEPRGELRSVQVRRTVTDAANPFLLDHTIGEGSVLPFTCAASWIIETSERVNPGYKFAEWSNMRVLKGITPAEVQDGELVLELAETAYSHGERIVLEATIKSRNANSKPVYHYKGALTLLWHAPTQPAIDGFTPPSNSGRPGDPLYADGTLFHGPAFRGIRQVLSATSDAITMACVAPNVGDAQQGQFTVHRFNPFAVDVQLQSALVWSGQFKESGCLPSSIAGFDLYEPIPTGTEFFVTMHVQQHSDTKVVVDITAHDHEGNVYNRIRSAEYTLSPRLTELFQQASEVHQTA